MSKRPAELPLENNPPVGSPASKKPRVEDDLPEDDPRNGAVPAQRASGQELEQHDRNGENVLAAADKEGEALEEASDEERESPDEIGRAHV